MKFISKKEKSDHWFRVCLLCSYLSLICAFIACMCKVGASDPLPVDHQVATIIFFTLAGVCIMLTLLGLILGMVYLKQYITQKEQRNVV